MKSPQKCGFFILILFLTNTKQFHHHNDSTLKKLQGQKEVLYRLKLRSYRVIYKKYEDRLVILVVHVTTRESAYK